MGNEVRFTPVYKLKRPETVRLISIIMESTDFHVFTCRTKVHPRKNDVLDINIIKLYL